MSRDGSGNYSAPVNSWNPATNGAPATAADWTSLLSDIVAALTQSLSKDGQTVPTANMPMGNNKITGLADGVASTDAVTKGQLDLKLTASLVSAFALTLLDDADAAAMRTTLGTNTIPNAGANLVVGSMYVATTGFTLDTGLIVDGVYPIYNNSAATITIAQGAGVTLRLAGSTVTGTRSLVACGMASVWCLSSSEYIISGAGVT